MGFSALISALDPEILGRPACRSSRDQPQMAEVFAQGQGFRVSGSGFGSTPPGTFYRAQKTHK